MVSQLIREIRFNPLTRDVTIISTVRRFRPKITSVSGCPFCPGNEHQTPPATLVIKRSRNRFHISREYGDLRSKEWDVRIVPNKFSALSVEDATAYGYHEVVIETPKHVQDPYELTCEEYAVSLYAAILRIKEILVDPRIEYVAFIKNRGLRAGASIAHTHSQIFGLPFIPPRIQEELAKYTNGCPVCSYIENELRDRSRVIYVGERYVVLASYAPRLSYEVIVAPLKHSSTPLDLEYEDLLELAYIIRCVTRSYILKLSFDAYNFWLHMAPKNRDFHWHLVLSPVSATWGGLEKSSHVYIVEVPPEEACEAIKRSFTEEPPQF